MFHKNCAVLAWRDGSGMLIFPCHFWSQRSSKLLGTSSLFTNSVLYKMPTGVTRIAVSCPSLSLNFAGKFTDAAGEYLANTPSGFPSANGPLAPIDRKSNV